MNSLDPRVKRLPQFGEEGSEDPKTALSQFGTFEVFVQPNPKKPFQHEGAVHAPNIDMAYVLAKEAFTRRFTCSSLYVVNTSNVSVSPITEGNQSVYEVIKEPLATGDKKHSFEIYVLQKRGKQHVYVGDVLAASAEEAFWEAGKKFNKGVQIFNLWAIPTNEIRFTSADENDFWTTLGEKKFRDASDYKGGDKLKEFLDKVK